jgi:hypothetical protein
MPRSSLCSGMVVRQRQIVVLIVYPDLKILETTYSKKKSGSPRVADFLTACLAIFFATIAINNKKVHELLGNL